MEGVTTMKQKNRQDLRDGRIPVSATLNGEFVIDVLGASDGMLTINDMQDRMPYNRNRLYPVYDARNGSSIGRMSATAFVAKFI
jgi:hypothetical protein